VKVTVVEVKQVDLPEQMIRAIGRQAEAERDRRAKIIHAEGEYMAAEKLAMAAELIQKQPAALTLRYLQTLVEIGSDKNTTVVFPLPIDIFSSLAGAIDHLAGKKQPEKKLEG
jgi:regulator of protease activity HflC (stomatin/prohibitin superfamily)